MTSRRRLAAALDKVFPHLLIFLCSLGDCVSGHGASPPGGDVLAGGRGFSPPAFSLRGSSPPCGVEALGWSRTEGVSSFEGEWGGGSPRCGFYVSVWVTVLCYVAGCSTSYPRLSRDPSTPPATPHRFALRCGSRGNSCTASSAHTRPKPATTAPSKTSAARCCAS